MKIDRWRRVARGSLSGSSGNLESPRQKQNGTLKSKTLTFHFHNACASAPRIRISLSFSSINNHLPFPRFFSQSTMAHHETKLIVPTNPNTLKSPRRSSSLSIIDGIFARKSFFYDRLPSQPLRLTVLKLDGSCFHIQVSKTATVSELKDAVEAVFSHVPHKGPAKISWAHVWGQFCLCYDEQKLVTENDYLRNYGIKDGDQLRFIRHVSNNCCVARKRLKKRVVYLKQRSRRRSTQVNSCQPKRNCDDDEIGSDDEATEDAEIKHHVEDKEEQVGKNKFAGFMGELFSYTPLAVVRRTNSRIWPSSIPRCLLGSLKKIRSIVWFGRRRNYSRRLPWRQH